MGKACGAGRPARLPLGAASGPGQAAVGGAALQGRLHLPRRRRIPAVEDRAPFGRQHRADALAASASPAGVDGAVLAALPPRSEEHTSELQSLMRTSYAVF